MSTKQVVGFAMIVILSAIALYSNNLGLNSLSSSIEPTLLNRFEQWRNEHGISFDSVESVYRFEVFKKNLEQIEKHNSKSDRTYDLGLNMFSHLTNEEFVQKYLTMAVKQNNKKALTSVQQNQKMQVLGDVDWQVLGKVSPVKAQGTCDAGYAFCSVSLVETRLLMKNQGALLSEQQVIDCSADYTTFGCSSGSRAGTLKFAREKGLVLATTYPYQGVKGQCKNATGNFKIDFDILESNGCDEIKSNLYKTPMTIAVNAQTWQSYKSGVYNGCTSNEVNHDVYLVGVTTSGWRVKNSWGIRWGEYGYIRLALGNTCGLCEKTGFGIKN